MQVQTYRTGPFLVSLKARYAPLLETRARLYPDTAAATAGEIVDFYVTMHRPRSPRGWLKPQILFQLENATPFEPYPLDHAFPLLEWGLNWCIATQAHQYLMLHSAVVEREGDALILPALPGSGKSTLCAALAYRGWRLLSDEFGLIEPANYRIAPLPRAVPLKNRSIEVIRRFAPDAYLGPVFEKTRKGTVAHMRPPADSLARQQEPARPRWIVFPRFQADTALTLSPVDKALAFTRLAHNSFNYRLLGLQGFRTLIDLIRRCDCYSLRYSDLDAAIGALDRTLFR
jgi:HprK-related kinase A